MTEPDSGLKGGPVNAAMSSAAPEVSFLASCIHPHLKVLGGGRCLI